MPKNRRRNPEPLRIMVSSSVYDKEDLLRQVSATLVSYGYKVWLSDLGTLPIVSDMSAFDNCLKAVEECDIFLGILTGHYGSAVGEELSITHQEFIRAIELEKIRYFAVHDNITIARQLLRQYRFDNMGNKNPHTFYKKTAIMSDARVLDMYDLIIRENLPFTERTGNWAQHYRSPQDLMVYLEAQFSEPERLRALLERRENEKRA